MIAASMVHQEAMGFTSGPSGMFNCDQLQGLVYASDMKINYGAATPISDANPTGSRVSNTGLVLSWDGHSVRNGKAKNFADSSGATDGTASGGVALGGVMGPRGPATAFDGVDDQAIFALAPTAINSGISFRLMFKPGFDFNDNQIRTFFDTMVGDGRFSVIKSSGNGLWSYFGASGQATFNISSPSWWTQSAYLDMVVVFDIANQKVRLYVDGVERSTVAAALTPETISQVAYGKYTSAAYYSSMAIAEAEVWGRAITQTEVRQQFEDTFGWVRNTANPHCKDISDTYPLGSDRVSSTGLVLSLDMETLQPDGKLKDFSGAGNHATITGAKYQRGAIKNGAYLYGGVSDKLTLTAFGLTDSFSVLAVVKPTASVSGQGIICSNQGSSLGWAYELDATNKPKLRVGDGTDVVDSLATTAVTIGQVSILAITFQKINDTQSTLTFYLNGVLDRQVTITQLLANGSGLAFIGVDQVFSGKYFTGTLGQVAVFNNVQTADQVAQLTLDAQKMLGLVQGNPGNVPGQVGSAVDLNGTSQYVEVADCPALGLTNQYTLGGWLNVDSVISKYALSKWGDTVANCAYSLKGDASGDIGIGSSDGATANVVYSPSPLGTSKWRLAAGTVSGTAAKIYVDGVQANSGSSALTAQRTSYPLRIGCVSTSVGSILDGRLAFPFIMSRAATAAEISKLYLSGKMARW